MGQCEDMYVELIKRCILDIIYDVEVHEDWKFPIGGVYVTHEGKRVLSGSQGVLEGAYWPKRAHSMIGLKRMNNIQHCVESVFRDGIEGDFIETGVWRGGATIFMAALNKFHGQNRKIFVADSFCGLPVPDEDKYPEDKGDSHHTFEALKVSLEEVRMNFRRYGLLDENIIFLEGFFEDTLPSAPIEKLAVLRLDGDMYGSTMAALDNLYHKVSKGGFIIIDDYALKGCRKAVLKFRKDHEIYSPIEKIDYMGVFWRK